jgi:predicted phage terminase large subunit-like protein
MQALEEAAAHRVDGLVVSMPPQHGKSELCSRYLPAWYLGTYPDRRVILTSYEADFASTWGRKTRDLVDEWGHLFGVRVSKRSSAIHRWDLEGRDGGMSTAGVGGPITGRGAHLLIIDDPIKNDEEARSPTHRQKQWEWWQSVASTRLRPGGLTVLIQTRWHRDDLTGRLLREAQTNGQVWWSVKLPALAEANDPLGRAEGEALWPEVYSAEALERRREANSTYYWRSLYQQDPLAEGGTEWPEAFFGPNIWFEEWPQSWRCRVIALDPSKGRDGKTGDYSAFALLVVGNDGTLYVDADMGVRHTTAITATAIDLQRSFQPDAFGVETNQFQELLAADLQRVADQRHLFLPLWTINNQVPKLVRIRRLTPHLSLGRLRFKAGSPGAKLLVEQLRDFPCGQHDDGPDALEMALRLAGLLLQRPSDEIRIERCWA